MEATKPRIAGSRFSYPLLEYTARAARWKQRFAALQRPVTALFVSGQAPAEPGRLVQRVRQLISSA
ncbi:MAG: hypothetical protein WBO06_04830 [Gammaproteobacteria bacterium]